MNSEIYCKNCNNKKYDFYCFDEKEYYCYNCFIDHRDHKFGLRAELEDISKFRYSMNNQTNFLDTLKKHYDSLIEINENLKKEIITTEKVITDTQKRVAKSDEESINVLNDYNDFQNFNKNKKNLFDIQKSFVNIDNIEKQVRVLKRSMLRNYDINTLICNKDIVIESYTIGYNNYNFINILSFVDQPYNYICNTAFKNQFINFKFQDVVFIKKIIIKSITNESPKEIRLKVSYDKIEWKEAFDGILEMKEDKSVNEEIKIAMCGQYLNLEMLSNWGGANIKITKVEIYYAKIID